MDLAHDYADVKDGAEVTVLLPAITKAVVRWEWRAHTSVAPLVLGGIVMYKGTEGITWCRGHSGPAVDALLAAEALR